MSKNDIFSNNMRTVELQRVTDSESSGSQRQRDMILADRDIAVFMECSFKDENQDFQLKLAVMWPRIYPS